MESCEWMVFFVPFWMFQRFSEFWIGFPQGLLEVILYV